MRPTSAAREVRPFIGVENLQDVLDGVRLAVGSQSLGPSGRANLSPRSFLRERVSLHLGENDRDVREFTARLLEAAAAAQLAPESVSLVLVLSTARLKTAEPVWQLQLDQLGSLQPLVPIADATERPAALQTPFGACAATLFVVLNRRLPQVPLRPWRKGTWLARVQFTVATELSEFGFTPIPLDDSERSRLGLGPDVLRFVQVDSPLQRDGAHDCVLVYVDHEVLDAMSTTAYAPAARALQAQLFLDVVHSIVHEASRQLQSSPDRDTLDDIEGSMLWHILRRAIDAPDPPSGDDRHHMQNLMGTIIDRPDEFLSRTESWIPDLKKHFISAIVDRA